MADKETAERQHAPTEGQGSRLAALRELAQKHLQEIGQQDEKERLEEQEVHAVLQEEAMRRSKTKTATAEGQPILPEDKGGKMRTAQGQCRYLMFYSEKAILTIPRRPRSHTVGS